MQERKLPPAVPAATTMVLLLLTPVVGCEREDTPTNPQSGMAPASPPFEDGRFYYYREGPGYPDHRIALELDPTELIVGAVSRSEGHSAILRHDLQVESMRGAAPSLPGQYRVRLSGLDGQGIATAGEQIRADPQIHFVGHAYTTTGGGRILLVNRLVVRFRPGVTAEDIEALVDSLAMDVERAPEPTGRQVWWLAYPRGEDPLRFAAELHHHPLVDWASPDRLSDWSFDDHLPSDPDFEEQYYLASTDSLNGVPVDIGVSNAWHVTKGDGVLIGVIGFGIDGTHSELSSQRAGGPCHDGWDEVFADSVISGGPWQPWGELNFDGVVQYEDDHETQVAGILVAQHDGTRTVGIAPEAELVSARTHLATVAWTTEADMANAIEWSWSTCGVDVVNGSWHMLSPSTDIADAITEGANKGRDDDGTVFVFSAGNNQDTVAFPASHSKTIAVGAINRSGGQTAYSPVLLTSTPALVAPSGHVVGACDGNTGGPNDPNVYTTSLSGTRGCSDHPASSSYTISFSGTSATAPQVAGAAALLISDNPNLTREQVTALLADSADHWGSYAQYGSGKLNIAASLGLGDPPSPSVTIIGLDEVPPDETCVWWADPSGGTSPYTYAWYKDGQPVGSTSTASVFTGTSNFSLWVDIEDHLGQVASDTMAVTVGSFGECFERLQRRSSR